MVDNFFSVMLCQEEYFLKKFDLLGVVYHQGKTKGD